MMRDYVIEGKDLTEEERVARQNYLSDQLMNGGLQAINGITIADRAAQTAMRVNPNSLQAAGTHMNEL